MKSELSALVFVSALVACGTDGSEPELTDGRAPSESRAVAILSMTGDAEDGAPIYAINCQACHGASGEGGAGGGIALQGLRFDETLMNSVLNGKNYMPAYGDTLSDQELADVVAHVESF